MLTVTPLTSEARAAVDPLRDILRLGARRSQEGLIVGVVLAFALHVGALAAPLATLFEMAAYVEELHAELKDFFSTEYDVVVEEEKVAPPPEPAPEAPAPEPEPAAPLPNEPPPPEDDPYPEDKPPEAGEAPDVYTQEDDNVEELPGTWSIPDKDGSTSLVPGYVAPKGKSKTAVRDRRARQNGRKGGTGSSGGNGNGNGRKSQARSATYSGGSNWNCPFPPQADLEQIDRATATVVVSVGADGRAKGVQVVSDPGYGFGAMAKQCAMSQRYEPALDADGRRIGGTTPPINVRFRR
jgi:protein TonB